MLYHVVAADALSTQRQYLWHLCYRVTGSAADADVVLRDVLADVVDRPLVDKDADARPHLTRSAALLAMDALRQRKYRRYVGCWLPSPIETGIAASRAPRPPTSSQGPRYDMIESGSFAFLTALEALEPRERTILLLCDAFGVDASDAASTLGLTPLTARAVLQHARRKMEPYDSTDEAPTAEAQAQADEVLRRCVSHLQHHDIGRLERTLEPDVRLCFDSAGEFVAPLAPVSGAARVAKLLLKFANGSAPIRFVFRMLNGLPAALGTSPGRPRWARRFVFRVETRGNLVSEVQAIMASEKLTAVRFDTTL